jgi:DnaK suppressor protein
MEPERARALLDAERARVQQLLADLDPAQTDDREAERETGDMADPAQPLAEQGVDDAVAAGLRDRLAALDRALQRLEDGTYGRSIRTGAPIPDERLEADPAAELTVQVATPPEPASASTDRTSRALSWPVRWAVMNPNTSAATTSCGCLATTPKNTLRS